MMEELRLMADVRQRQKVVVQAYARVKQAVAIAEYEMQDLRSQMYRLEGALLELEQLLAEAPEASASLATQGQTGGDNGQVSSGAQSAARPGQAREDSAT